MKGITMEELCERLTYGHEAEFTYNNTPYVIQPEEHDAKTDLVIWILSSKPACISRHPIPSQGDIPSDCIDAVLNDKCFDGKSFIEIQNDITVDAIL